MPETHTIIVNPSPKARFMSDKDVIHQHREIMQRDDLQMSLDFALLEYQRLLAGQKLDANGAAANHFKTVGALEFINVLKHLGESEMIQVATDSRGNLNHNV